MPNWCNNILVVKGNNEELKTLMNEIKSEKTFIDFNKIIPCKIPKEIKEKWNNENSDVKKRFDNDFERYVFNEYEYKWNITNWGTKWEAEVEAPTINDEEMVYGFSTAWSPPLPIIEKLITKYPLLDFSLEYEEWGECFAGEMVGEKGEVVFDEEWEINIAECPCCEQTNIKKVKEKVFVCSDCNASYVEINDEGETREIKENTKVEE